MLLYIINRRDPVEATVNHRDTRETIKIALETFEALNIFMSAKYEDNVRRATKERLARSWFPNTKKALNKRLANSEALMRYVDHGLTPSYYYWANRQLEACKTLDRRWLAVKTKMDASIIVLNDEEIDLLSEGVTAARQLLAGIKC
jgi:hypothetical protein